MRFAWQQGLMGSGLFTFCSKAEIGILFLAELSNFGHCFGASVGWATQTVWMLPIMCSRLHFLFSYEGYHCYCSWPSLASICHIDSCLPQMYLQRYSDALQQEHLQRDCIKALLFQHYQINLKIYLLSVFHLLLNYFLPGLNSRVP